MQEAGAVTKVLCFSTLYPNCRQPNHGIFVENRLRHTLALGDRLTASVLAPIPYFPFRSSVWGRYAKFAAIPAHETRHGLDVYHPRFAAIPRIGSFVTPDLLAFAAGRRLSQLMADGVGVDVIDAHYFYPDGVAAAVLAKRFGKPFIVTARGSDLTQHANDPRQRRQIIAAAHAATALVTVSNSLKQELVRLGVSPSRIAVLRNGVDADLFRAPVSRRPTPSPGEPGFRIMSVGALIPRKAHDIAIRAMSLLPDCDLTILGAGELRNQLQTLATDLNVSDRVHIIGEVPHRELPQHYGNADAMVLLSSREGWANVILEALACGTPVIASNVGGAGEIIRRNVAGTVINERSPEALATAIKDLRQRLPERADTRKYAEAFGWRPVAEANARLLEAVAKANDPLQNVADDFSVLSGDID